MGYRVSVSHKSRLCPGTNFPEKLKRQIEEAEALWFS